MSDVQPKSSGRFRLFVRRLAGPVLFIAAGWIAGRFLPADAAVRPYLEAVLFFFAAVLGIRLIDTALLVWYDRRRKPFPIPDLLRDLILGILYLVVLFFVLKSVLQVNVTPILTTSAILTMILGLALQGILNNLLSGISLHVTKSFSRGDWVGIAGQEGVIVDTNWRETRLVDRQSNLVVLPNTMVAAERITNFSRPDLRTALFMTFRIAYDAPASEVVSCLLDAARDCPDVVADPAPQAYITSYEDLGVAYTLKFWVTDFARKNPIMGDVARLSWYKLRRRGVGSAVSLGDTVKDVARTILRTPPADERAIVAEVLRRSSFLRYPRGERAGERVVAESEIESLASLVRKAVYTQGEVLFRQGDAGTDCFLVVRGKIRGEIVYDEAGTTQKTEFTVGPGEIFGEMSLFTGMPRTATGIAAEDVELLVIEAGHFAVLLARNPALAEAIADIVSARNAEDGEALRKMRALSAADIERGTDRSSILAYLKKLIHLGKK